MGLIGSGQTYKEGEYGVAGIIGFDEGRMTADRLAAERAAAAAAAAQATTTAGINAGEAARAARKHGTGTMYRHGKCRCVECRAANAAYSKKQKVADKENQQSN